MLFECPARAVWRDAVSSLGATFGLLALVACDDTSSQRAEQKQTVQLPRVVPAPSPPPAAPAPALTRNDFLDAAARAASDYAAGQSSPEAGALAGQRFSIRIPFGCAGPSVDGNADAGIGHWTWGPERKTIELTMAPADWKNSAMIAQAGAGATWEAIEGFWVARPWISSEHCPTVKGDPLQTEVAASPQTLGIAAVFEAGGSRIGRREGRAYQFTVRSKDNAPIAAPERGYRLLLEGRMERFPEGRALECRAAGTDVRPVCVAAARLDRVAFETVDGDVLAEWRTD